MPNAGCVTEKSCSVNKSLCALWPLGRSGESPWPISPEPLQHGPCRKRYVGYFGCGTAAFAPTPSRVCCAESDVVRQESGITCGKARHTEDAGSESNGWKTIQRQQIAQKGAHY
jgi:hypothetical protein